MKKYLVILTAVFLLASLSSRASAETPGSAGVAPSAAELIKNLEAQINALKEKIAALTAAQTAAKTAAEEIKGTLRLVSGLREGMSNEEVKLLQIALSSDEEIYPEGLVTGFYGKATAEAVKRFQKKNNLEAVGFVGPKTLEKLNESLKQNPVIKDEKNKEHCAIVPPGHLIAPGWLRKAGGVRPAVPACETIPSGIQKQISDLAAKKEAVSPKVSGVTATEITANSARISWMTDKPTKGLIRYGTTTPLTAGQVMEMQDADPKSSHSHALTGLMPNTTYYYAIWATDASGSMAISAEYMFRTTASDATAPVISGVSTTDITQTSARIIWATNEPAASKVWISSGASVVTSGNPSAESSSLVTSHSLTLSNLTFGTTYRYVVSGADSSGNVSTSSEYAFSTSSGGGSGSGGGGY